MAQPKSTLARAGEQIIRDVCAACGDTPAFDNFTCKTVDYCEACSTPACIDARQRKKKNKEWTAKALGVTVAAARRYETERRKR